MWTRTRTRTHRGPLAVPGERASQQHALESDHVLDRRERALEARVRAPRQDPDAAREASTSRYEYIELSDPLAQERHGTRSRAMAIRARRQRVNR